MAKGRYTISIRLMILRTTDILTSMVCPIVDSPTAISPNVCLPNQPLFIANLYNLTQPTTPKHIPPP